MNEYIKEITNLTTIYSNYGYISYKYNDDIYFKIAKLTYKKFLNEEFQYIFEPYYDVLNVFPNLDIPGIDLSLKQDVYYRSNITPVFVSERITPKNRVNLQEELKEQNMDFYHPFLLLLDSKRTYGGDKLSLKSDAFYEKQVSGFKKTTDLYKNIPLILKQLAARSDVLIEDIEVTKHNRETLIKNYLFLYQSVSKYYDQKSKGSRGRKRKEVASVVLLEINNQYKHGVITIDEAVKKSGLGSKETYYRRLREIVKKKD